MSQGPDAGEKKSGGCLKVLGVMLVLGLAGTVVAGAVGTYLYVNREKLGIATLEDFRARLEGAAVEEERAGTEAETVRRPFVASAPKKGTSANYDQWIVRKDVLVLVDYYANWCPPCQQLAPQLEALAKNQGDKVVVVKINVDEEHELATRAGVQSIPDMRLLHGGRELEKIIGYRPATQLEQMVVHHAAILPPPPSAAGDEGAAENGAIQKMGKDWLPPGVTPIR